MNIELINETDYEAFGFYAELFDSRAYYSLAVKASFDIVKGSLVKRDDPIPIRMSDTYFGEPGESSLANATDLMPYVGRTDILVTGVARAPGVKPQQRWLAEIKIGDLYKKIQVTGPRAWQHSLVSGWKLSVVEPTSEVRLDYGLSFGGEHEAPDDEARDAWLPNPVGRGFVGRKKPRTENRWDAPQILAFNEELASGLGTTYTTAGLGPIPGDWAPRINRVGTTDDRWKKETAPHLPKDFDLRFYNCAPDDQQAEGYLIGNEQFACAGLFEEVSSFYLPSIRPTALMVDHDGVMISLDMDLARVHVDTLDRTLDLTWRISTQADEWKQACISMLETWN
jgi:hypothetical protein